jgi:sec-independent protein translocase protein TatB
MLLFFDLGAGEIFVIVLILIVVFGPKQIPEIARNLGKTINEMKRASSDFKNEINKEVQRIEREERYQEFLKLKSEPELPENTPPEENHNAQITKETVSKKQTENQ